MSEPIKTPDVLALHHAGLAVESIKDAIKNGTGFEQAIFHLGLAYALAHQADVQLISKLQKEPK